MALQFNNPNVFQHNSNSQGTNANSRGYPNQWSAPHWGPDNQYNPNLVVYANHPDGHREYYDPVNNTKSIEHPSGYHHAITADGVIENVPGKKMSFVGSGGHSETISGHHDVSVAGHSRQNFQGDTYTNVKGVAHSFHQGGAVSCNMGNESHDHYGSVKHRVMGENGGWGVGVGQGDGQNHDSAMSMTKDRIIHRQSSQGDMVHATNANTVASVSGKDHNTYANTDINAAAQGDHTSNANGSVVHVAGGNTYNQANSFNVASAPKHYMTGQNNQQTQFMINGIAMASSFVTGNPNMSVQTPKQMPSNPLSSGSSGGSSSSGGGGGIGGGTPTLVETAGGLATINSSGMVFTGPAGTITANDSGFYINTTQVNQWQGNAITSGVTILTTAATGTVVMNGTGFYFTPIYSSRIFVQIDVSYQLSTSTGWIDIQGYYGSGTAPSAGVGATGTTFTIQGVQSTGDTYCEASVSGIIKNLTPGVQYWIDYGIRGSGSTMTGYSGGISAYEL